MVPGVWTKFARCSKLAVGETDKGRQTSDVRGTL